MKNLVEKSKEFAINIHCNPQPQRYGGNTPYSKHLQDVVDVCLRYLYLLPEECHTDVISACWLHDSVEDSCMTPNKIQRLFNFRIADIVYRVTNEIGWTREEKNFKTYPKIWSNDLAIFVKICDRISNTRNSKNGFDENSSRMYKIYTKEYLIFRSALKVRNLYEEMWNELDILNTP